MSSEPFREEVSQVIPKSPNSLAAERVESVAKMRETDMLKRCMSSCSTNSFDNAPFYTMYYATSYKTGAVANLFGHDSTLDLSA